MDLEQARQVGRADDDGVPYSDHRCGETALIHDDAVVADDHLEVVEDVLWCIGNSSVSKWMARRVFVGAEIMGTSAGAVTVTSTLYTTALLRVISSRG